jgi:hypothetical protein
MSSEKDVGALGIFLGVTDSPETGGKRFISIKMIKKGSYSGISDN